MQQMQRYAQSGCMTALYGVHLSCLRVSACSQALLDFSQTVSSILCVLDAHSLITLLLMTLPLLLHMYLTKQWKDHAFWHWL